MGLLRLLFLIPALCFGLLGQGHGWVLCQADRCVCLQIEGTCNCSDDSMQESEGVAVAQAQEGHAATHAAKKKHCHDSSLDAGPYLLVKAEKLPGLKLFVAATWPSFSWIQSLPVSNGQLSSPIRGPPHASAPPQILKCLSHVVMLV